VECGAAAGQPFGVAHDLSKAPDFQPESRGAEFLIFLHHAELPLRLVLTRSELAPERSVLAPSCRTGASRNGWKVADRTHSPGRPATRTICAKRKTQGLQKRCAQHVRMKSSAAFHAACPNAGLAARFTKKGAQRLRWQFAIESWRASRRRVECLSVAGMPTGSGLERDFVRLTHIRRW
jgi:hypothetical protein